MKEKNKEPVIFRLRYSRAILAVLIVFLVLCAACIALATWQVIILMQEAQTPTMMEWLKYGIMYFVAVFLAALDIAMLAKSQYVITGRELITQFGFIKSKYEINGIFSLRLYEKTNKLAVYFDDFKTKYMVILVREEWYDDFVKALQSRNEKIEFELVCPEDKPDKDNKKNDKKKK